MTKFYVINPANDKYLGSHNEWVWNEWEAVEFCGSKEMIKMDLGRMGYAADEFVLIPAL